MDIETPPARPGRIARLGRLTITRKFVGLSVTLLAIMLAAAVYAFVQSAKVNRETALLVEVLEPLKREVATIEEFAAEEELASERALRYGGPQVRDPALHESYLERFRALNTRVDSQLAQLDTNISRFETMPVSNDVAVFLGRLQLESEAVRREHAAYRAAMDAFLDPKAPAMVDGVRLRQTAAMDAERRVLAAMERMSREASVLSGKDERQLEALERRGFSVTVENLILAVFAFLAGAVISVLLTRRMLTPVRSLIAGAEEVGRGNLEVSLPATTHDELGQLTTAFSAMVEELRQKVALKNTFSSYMDPRVVDRLLGANRAELEAGEKREMTVYFSDVQGFSAISETLTPTALVRLVNRYLTLAAEPIHRHHGVIDKYIGDAVMAYWGPPFALEEPALSAVIAALEQREQIARLQRELPELLGLRRGAPSVSARIGLATGDVVVGSIGSAASRNFTIMGDTVNIASRLESANKTYGTLILADEATMLKVRHRIEAREIDLLAAPGKSEAVRIYELLGEIGEVEPHLLAARDAHAHALALYRAREWDKAEAAFAEALRIAPEDGPARVFLTRIAAFRSAPPPADWAGIWLSPEK
ncbi:MAG: hypothetical protein ABT11_09300 [Novosphingobium sp. SCN 66-18]|nr:MAG: hypothetical protein ABT11_09300 [Novosphingobium sp. SCN 66-18]